MTARRLSGRRNQKPERVSLTFEMLEGRLLPSITIRTVSLKANDLVYDPYDRLIYATVPGSAGSVGNSITPIDPATGAIGHSVFVGSEPGRLVETDDGLYLYTILSGAGSIRRYNIPNGTAYIQWSLGPGHFARDIAPVPGDSTAVSVTVESVVTVYDDGVARSHSSVGGSSLAAGTTGDTLYGYENQGNGFGLYRLHLDSSGVTTRDQTGSLICCFNTFIRYDAGRVYSTHGEVIDPEPATGPPLLVGTLAGVGFGSSVAPDATTDRTYFLRDNTLIEYRQDTFTLVAQYNLPSGGGSLIRWGRDGLAYQNGTLVYLLTIKDESAPSPLQFLPVTPSDVQPADAAPPPGGEQPMAPAPLSLAARMAWVSPQGTVTWEEPWDFPVYALGPGASDGGGWLDDVNDPLGPNGLNPPASL